MDDRVVDPKCFPYDGGHLLCDRAFGPLPIVPAIGRVRYPSIWRRARLLTDLAIHSIVSADSNRYRHMDWTSTIAYDDSLRRRTSRGFFESRSARDYLFGSGVRAIYTSADVDGRSNLLSASSHELAWSNRFGYCGVRVSCRFLRYTTPKGFRLLRYHDSGCFAGIWIGVSLDATIDGGTHHSQYSKHGILLQVWADARS